MNLYTVHQKKQKVTSVLQSQTNKSVFSSCLNCPKSSCHRVVGRLFQTCGQRQRNFLTCPWDCAAVRWVTPWASCLHSCILVVKTYSIMVVFKRRWWDGCGPRRSDETLLPGFMICIQLNEHSSNIVTKICEYVCYCGGCWIFCVCSSCK